jgi:putative hydrolase of the HAD superfamily
MSLLRFQALSIEVVGTVIDVERGMLDYLRQAAPGLRVRDDEFLHACRVARASPLADCFPDDLERVWTEVAREFGLPRQAGAGFRASVAQWPACADAVAALGRLQRHYRLVAATNAQRWAMESFQRTLGIPFDAVVTCDDTAREKPDPRYFVRMGEILAAQGLTPARTLHVGHSQFHDIRVAHALGWRTCWIERHCASHSGICCVAEDKPVRPDWKFTTLRQLAAAVEVEEAQRQRVAEAIPGASWALA